MILEHRGVLTHARPNITFKYITPLQPKIQSVVYQPQTLVRSQPLPIIFRKQMVSYVVPKEQQESQRKPSQRKKIFDRTYTCKSAFYREASREASLDSKQKIQKYQAKKQRKAIFPKRNKNTAFTHYPFHNYSPPQSEVKHSASLAAFTQQLHTQSENYAPFVHHIEPTSTQYKSPSIIKVEMSESATDRSIDNSEVFQLPNNTDERFYDRDSLTPKRNNEKLAEVNLYTTVNGNFLTKPEQTSSTLHDLLKSIKSQLQTNLLPFLLILLGFFILFVQATQ